MITALSIGRYYMLWEKDIYTPEAKKLCRISRWCRVREPIHARAVKKGINTFLYT
jgi:hypothetical protein